MAGRSAILNVKILGDARDAQRAFGSVESSAGKWSGALKAGGLAAAAGIAVAAKAAFDWAKAAADDQRAAGKLATALRNTAGATDAQVKATEDWISAQGKALGVADDDLRPALMSLATATKDVGKAQSLASLAMDVSAARGVDLKTASDAIAKAYAGQTTAIGRLVPGLDRAAVKSGDFAQVQAALGKVVGGQASEAANTAAGKWDRFQLSLSELTESIGGLLLPIFEAATDALNTYVIPALEKVVAWVGSFTSGVTGAAGGGDLFRGAMDALGKVFAVFQPTVTAVGDYVTGTLVPAWRSVWSAIQANVVPAFQRLATALAPVWHWIGETLGPFLVGAFGGAFRVVAGIVTNVVVPAFAGIIDVVTNVVRWLTRAAATVGGAFSGAWSAVTGIIDNVTNAIRSVIDWISRAVSAVGDFLANLNPLKGIGDAIGGLFGRSAAPAVPMARSAGTTATAAAPAGGTVIHVHGALDPHGTARTIQRYLTGADTRTGRVRMAGG